jgi:hypothetical protein
MVLVVVIEVNFYVQVSLSKSSTSNFEFLAQSRWEDRPLYELLTDKETWRSE